MRCVARKNALLQAIELTCRYPCLPTSLLGGNSWHIHIRRQASGIISCAARLAQRVMVTCIAAMDPIFGNACLILPESSLQPDNPPTIMTKKHSAHAGYRGFVEGNKSGTHNRGLLKEPVSFFNVSCGLSISRLHCVHLLASIVLIQPAALLIIRDPRPASSAKMRQRCIPL